MEQYSGSAGARAYHESLVPSLIPGTCTKVEGGIRLPKADLWLIKHAMAHVPTHIRNTHTYVHNKLLEEYPK